MTLGKHKIREVLYYMHAYPFVSISFAINSGIFSQYFFITGSLYLSQALVYAAARSSFVRHSASSGNCSGQPVPDHRMHDSISGDCG